ncbi:MAG TPA: polyphosphate polymerase domain-containing protein [Actinoplanes sp.]|nr:polyphosphate polymerase domain-containing protein [Actinoplanes sp.]
MTVTTAHFDPITLAELTATAELQTRTDRKYVLPLAEAEALMSRLDPGTRVLEIGGERTFRYRSVYFDTPDLISFRLTAYKRRRRFKVRTRTYLDSSLCWLEVKTEGYRGGTVKDRLPYRIEDQDTVEPGRWFVDDILGASESPRELTPTLLTHYRRTTFCQATGDSRLTVDVDLVWTGTDGRELGLPDVAVVETKTGSAASAADRLLWASGHRPTSISKYATGLTALQPGLPDVRWRRLKRRHFTPVTED